MCILNGRNQLILLSILGVHTKGLGFLYIDIEENEDWFKHWMGMDNFGVITIEEGEIDEEGILENLRELFDKDWA